MAEQEDTIARLEDELSKAKKAAGVWLNATADARLDNERLRAELAGEREAHASQQRTAIDAMARCDALEKVQFELRDQRDAALTRLAKTEDALAKARPWLKVLLGVPGIGENPELHEALAAIDAVIGEKP